MKITGFVVKSSFVLSFLGVVLGVVASDKSYAVNIIQRSPYIADNHLPYERYVLPTHTGEVWLPVISKLARGGTPGLRSLLASQATNWIFESSTRDLLGDFLIDTYRVCPPAYLCGNNINGIGGILRTVYIPKPSDPGFVEDFVNSPKTLVWLQRVTSNHKVFPGGKTQYGVPEDVIDYDFDFPFYYPPNNIRKPLREGLDFVDAPYRPGSATLNHVWNAELFLGQITGPNKVTIYEGMRWGWRNRAYKRNTCTVAGPVTSCPPPGGSGGGGLRVAGTNLNKVEREEVSEIDGFSEFDEDISIFPFESFATLSNSDYLSAMDSSVRLEQELNSSSSKEPITEPSIIFPLLALGIWSIYSWAKT
jgi:hypothetical protein